MAVRADLRGWKAIRNAIVRTEKRVKVGILNDSQHESEDGDEDGISMLELAAIHEFGVDLPDREVKLPSGETAVYPAMHIPERSFIRATINGKRDEVNAAIEEIVGIEVKKLLEIERVSEAQADAAAQRALGRLGTKIVSMIRATIRNKQTVGPEDQANKPSTIAKKGSSTPLVDTGQLINAVTYAVIDGKDDE